MKNTKFYFQALLISTTQVAILAPAVCAQGTISNNAVERSTWYKAPRQYQIIDNRPLIRDFREGPNDPGRTPLPGGPGGTSGASGGPGGGALGGGTGGDVLPSGGMQIPGDGSQPGYRSDPTGMGSLPKSGFGGSNIPIGGLAPRGILPSTMANQSVVGKILQQNKNFKQKPIPQQAVAARGRSVPVVSKPAPPVIASYGNNYSAPTNYGSSLGNSQKVRGTLINHK